MTSSGKRRNRNLSEVPTLIIGLLLLHPMQAEDSPAELLRKAESDLANGRYSAVLKDSEQSAELFRKAGDRAGEGRALNLLGRAQLYSGLYSAALVSFTAALNVARQLGDTSSQIVRLNNTGNVYYYQGRYSEALARYTEAQRLVNASSGQDWLPARRQLTLANIAILYQTLGQNERALDIYNELLNSPRALPPEEHAQLLANVGTLRRRLGDPRKALDTYREAQALYQKTANHDGEIAVLNNIGIVQARDLGEFNEALKTFTGSLKLAEESGSRALAIHARMYRGEAFYRAGRAAESRADFESAVDAATKLGQLEESWKALFGLARISSERGETAEADALLKQAVNAIERLRAGLKQSSLRSDFLADKRDVYDLLLEHTSDPAEVFHLMEQSRARTLQDRTQPASIARLADIAQRLPADTAVVEYWLGARSAKALWITRDSQVLASWAVTPDEMKALTDLPSIMADPNRSDWRAAASGSARSLLGQISELGKKGVNRIVIVPDGMLARIPFEALPLDADLLIQHVRVSYLPSASLITNESRTADGVRWPWQTTIEAFADPRPGSNASTASADRAWPPLPYAAHEVSGIAHALRGRAELYIGSDARKEHLISDPKPPVLHLAAHAFADMNDPARSYILLAPASPTEAYDRLFLKEVQELNLKAVDLVTASACETDAGKLVRGEGVQSFSRAFLEAGARSVVTSLWAVGDRATADMMLRFYSRLADGESKADALRSAKLEMLARPASAHPAHWAAFVLNGESRTPIPHVVGWTFLLLPPAGLAGGIVLLRFRKRAGKV